MLIISKLEGPNNFNRLYLNFNPKPINKTTHIDGRVQIYKSKHGCSWVVARYQGWLQ